MVTCHCADKHAPSPALHVTDVAITRFKHVYKVEPSLITEHVTQQAFPNWALSASSQADTTISLAPIVHEFA